MANRKNEDVSVEFTCIGTCESPPTWMVDGRHNAEGEFESHDDEEMDCPECFERGEPTDRDVKVVDA